MNLRTTTGTLAASALIAASSAFLGFSIGSHGGGARPAVASEEDDQQRIVAAVKHAAPSVVALEVTVNGTQIVPRNPFGFFFGNGIGSPFGFGNGLQQGGRAVPFHEQASGSGFVYGKGGFIVTNDHVVHHASKITVVFASGDRVPATVYSEDPAADLALVKVTNDAKLPPPLELAPANDVAKGEFAIAIGEPLELKQTVTLGIVSGFHRDETIGGASDGPRQFTDLLQTSAPINPGNSGGPLLDIDGRVIGVNQSVVQPAQGIGFAIPIDTVARTVALLEQHPGVVNGASGGFIGVRLEPLDAGVKSAIGYTGTGVVVEGVVGGSPADRAGLQPGDVIQQVDRKPVERPSQSSRRFMRSNPAGSSAWRSGRRARADWSRSKVGKPPAS